MSFERIDEKLMLRAAIFSDGREGVGFGHLSRCAGLVEACAQRGIVSKLILAGDSTLRTRLPGDDVVFTNWMNDPASGSHAADAEIIVVDSYAASDELLAKLFQQAEIVLFLDDECRTQYPGGIILNSSPAANAALYPYLRADELLLGSQFAMLRDHLRTAPKSTPRRELRNILLTIGGSPLPGVSQRIQSVLAEVYPGIDVVFAASLSPHEMLSAMTSADLAITGGGQTLLELLSLGVPAIAISIATNQNSNIAGAARAGAALDGGHVDAELPERLAELVRSCTFERRTELSSNGRSLVDGLGAPRTLSALLDRLIDRALRVRSACIADSGHVLALSNLDSVRSVSLTTSRITPAEHDVWFGAKLSDPRSIYFVADLRGKLMGQIRFQCSEREALVSTSIHPSVRSCGIGSRLMKAGVAAVRERFPTVRTIAAQVRASNAESLRYVERAGFVRCGEEAAGGETVFRYEFVV